MDPEDAKTPGLPEEPQSAENLAPGGFARAEARGSGSSDARGSGSSNTLALLDVRFGYPGGPLFFGPVSMAIS
ncbi:MAG: hypothetical protein D6788_09815, partial [Planctomycetota bacterium]